jgi:glycerate dehydrogenase
MKRRPLIINCGRGGLVNEADLVKALELGLIAGVGFDCLTSEPPQQDNPLLTVLDRPNVIVTTTHCMGQLGGHADGVGYGHSPH